MIKSKFKRVTSLFLATLMCVTTFAGIGSTTAYAASGEKADVYMVDFPRDGDANYDGVWGHSNLTLKNGWHTGRSNFTNLKAIGSYSGNVAYCIEPGISLKVGQTMNKYDENYFNNLAANGVISGDEIRLFVGRILQYGYRGTISTSWRSQNEAAANSIAQAYATQLLIWETVIGERDANFNHVAASGCSNVKDVINAKHPLRNKIFSYYNSMVQSVQNHATIPSFCNKSSGSAKTIELEWNGSKYTTTLTDSNNVLSKYNFKASISGVSFSVNGNKLTVSMDTAPSKEFTITATKKNAVRRGVVVWSEGKHGQNSSVQDVVSYAQEVSDSINGYVKMKVSYGSCQIVKTSEDGKVDGINFTITGNGINQTVTTANGGKFQIDNLMPGIYTVTEQAYDKYEPQETHRVTVVAGQVAKVNFNNKLKRGDLQVVKSSEDNLVEGVKFHLYGTSLSGDAVDQYAVTDKNGVAKAAPILGISQAALSQYRRSMYDKGDIEAVENKLKEFFQIQEEKTQNAQKAEPFRTKTSAGYIPTTISEEAYKLIRYCQLEKGIVVIDGDAGIGKTKAAAKFLQDNPSTTVYVKATPSTGSTRSLLKMIAKTLKLPENQRTEDLSVSIQEKLRETDKVIIIDEAQNLKFLTLEEIRGWVDEDIFTGKPGIGIVLIGNVEVYNKMLGKQEAIFAQQFNRTKLHGRYRTSDIQREDVVKFFPVLEEKGMQKEIDYLLSISHSKWGIRGMVSVFNNAVNNEDISFEGLEKMANTMGIRFI